MLFRSTDAHDIVGNIVALVLEDQTLIAGFTPERVYEESEKILGYPLSVTADEIESVLDPCRNVETKIHMGGPSKASVENMIKRGLSGVSEEADKLSAIRTQVENAYAVLTKKADALASAAKA